MAGLSPRWQTALDLHHKGLTTVQIGDQINAKACDVGTWLSKRGLKPNLHRQLFTDEQRMEACLYAEKHGTVAAAEKYSVELKTMRVWLADRGIKPASSRKKPGEKVESTKLPKSAEVRDSSVKMRWRGEKFRLVKDHSLLRYFLIRREDVSSLPAFCTVEHLFHDGRHAIHDRELVVSARPLRFHPSYLQRLANVAICDLRGTFSRMAMLESGLLKADDDYQLVDLILAMVERDRRRDRMEQTDNDD